MPLRELYANNAQISDIMSYSIVEGNITHHKTVLNSIWQRNQSDFTPGRYPWLYEKNSSGIPVVYLLKYEQDSSFVGAITLFPRAFFYNGGKVKAYICGDLVVDKLHRSLGPALSLIKAAIRRCNESRPCILLGIPNTNSENVMLRAGFEILADYCVMTRVIKSNRYLSKRIYSQFFSSILSLLVDQLLALRYGNFLRLGKSQYTTDRLSRFDKRFDNLCYTAITHNSFIGERNAQYLTWRFYDSPYNNYEIFGLLANGATRISGYLVYHIAHERAYISDLAFDMNDNSLTNLLSNFSITIQLKGCSAISVTFSGNPSLINIFRKNGYFLRTSNNRVIIYSSLDDKGFLNTIRAGQWYLTPADNDI